MPDPHGLTSSGIRNPEWVIPQVPGSRRPFSISGRHLAVAVAVVVALLAAGGWYFTARVNPDALLQQAEGELQAGRWDAARDRMRRLEQARAPTPRDRLLRARIATAAGDDADALGELGLISDDRELGVQALYLTGLIERRRKRVRFAEAAYRKVIEREPGNIKARKELLYILGMQFRRREVDAEFKALGRIAPLGVYDLYVWGLTHFVVWGPDSAKELQSFIDADPEDRYSRLALATLLLTQPGQSTRVAEVLGPLPQDDPEVIALRVEHELSQGHADEATRLIAATVADNAHLARLRGRIAMARGDRAAAVGYYRRALGDEPYDRVSNFELAQALRVQGDQAAAAPYLARARQLDQLYNLITGIRKAAGADSSADPIKLGKAVNRPACSTRRGDGSGSRSPEIRSTRKRSAPFIGSERESRRRLGPPAQAINQIHAIGKVGWALPTRLRSLRRFHPARTYSTRSAIVALEESPRMPPKSFQDGRRVFASHPIQQLARVLTLCEQMLIPIALVPDIDEISLGDRNQRPPFRRGTALVGVGGIWRRELGQDHRIGWRPGR